MKRKAQQVLLDLALNTCSYIPSGSGGPTRLRSVHRSSRMRFPKKDPGKGSTHAPVWSFESWQGGGYEAGWLGGEVVWLEAHHYFVTVPCHSFLSGGKLRCPHCEKFRPVVEVGYVPWIGESGKPMCSLVKHYARPAVAKLRVFDPITVGKGKNKFAPVWVKPRGGANRWSPTPGSERTGEQFEAWLLVIWKVQELTEYFAAAAQAAPAAAAQAAPAAAAQADDDERCPVGPMTRAAWERAVREQKQKQKPADGAVPLADVLPVIPNGKHHKPK